jgi:hypothetical protein
MDKIFSHGSLRLQHSTIGWDARFQVTPQLNSQFAGESDNTDLAQATATLAKALLIPSA